jgi:hypothetical protein
MPKSLSTTLLLVSLVAGCGGSNDGTFSEKSLSSPEHTAFNFFVSKGITREQAAGVVGNLMQESSVRADAIQFGGGPGRGIAQWSVGGRWDASFNDNVAWYARTHGGSPWALSTQLAFTWYELTTFSSYGLGELRASNSVASATTAFQDRFEICGQCDASQRIRFAEQALNMFGHGGGSSGGSGGGGAGCHSGTLGREVADNTCVQSRFDGLWYQCADGAWVDRWTDPDPCTSVHPL